MVIIDLVLVKNISKGVCLQTLKVSVIDRKPKKCVFFFVLNNFQTMCPYEYAMTIKKS